MVQLLMIAVVLAWVFDVWYLVVVVYATREAIESDMKYAVLWVLVGYAVLAILGWIFVGVFAAVPALLAAMAYAVLATAMPRAGGSYLYASRGLNPFLGFVASFSQWFGLSIVIGVIAYIIVPFLRDITAALGWDYRRVDAGVTAARALSRLDRPADALARLERIDLAGLRGDDVRGVQHVYDLLGGGELRSRRIGGRQHGREHVHAL